jgi:TDG/mug DNA glycosylase family protein
MLPDVLGEDLIVVFCGMAASRASARQGAYYAGPGNRFWPTLYNTGLTPRLLQPAQFKELPIFGIGLTDIVQGVSGNDSEIPMSMANPDAVRRKIDRHQPQAIAFNGKKAAALFFGVPTGRLAYGRQPSGNLPCRAYVLPSTSGAARGFWSENPWRELSNWAIEARESRI